MGFALRRESLGFLDRAPVVHVAEAVIAAPPRAVFDAFAEPRGWESWFPGVRHAAYTTPPPFGVGSIREADVRGTRWVEEMIEWRDPVLWGWTVVGSSVPFARAQVELFEFADVAEGTRVTWTLALEPRLLARITAPLAARTTPRLLRQAMANLATQLGR